MVEPVLDLKSVAKHYGGVQALRDVTFTVGAGEIVGLVGANGAGKSTLIDVISGVTPATSGSIKLEGETLRTGVARRARAGLARTFQHPRLALELTIRESILCGTYGDKLRSPATVGMWAVAGLLGVRSREDKVLEVAERLRIQDLDRKVGSLSFGEMRLTEFACALVQEPTLLMLDEPFPGVGDDGLKGMLEALEVARQNGRGVLLVDHNLDIVGSVVDRIALLVDGEIVLLDEADRCLAHPLLRRHYIGVD